MTVFVLLLPLWFALSGAVSTAVAAILRAGRVAAAQIISYAQLGFVVLAIVILLASGTAGVGSLWQIDLSATVFWIVLGVLVGPLCLAWEIGVSRVVAAVARHRWRTLLEGNSPSLVALNPRGPSWVIVGVGFAVAEEILWRGLASSVLLAAGWSEAAVVATLSVLFGVNHGWFGLRSVLAKTGAGLAWALLTVLSGSLYAAIASHLVFQVLVLRRLNRQSRKQSPADDNLESSTIVVEQ